jgi:hypothetical protein
MATASAGHADKGSSLSSRAFRAPLRRGRLAVCRRRFGKEKEDPRPPALPVKPEGSAERP